MVLPDSGGRPQAQGAGNGLHLASALWPRRRRTTRRHPRRSDAGSLPSESPRGARDEEGAWLDVTVNRSDDGKGALGLDVNEANRICRIAPSSAAAKDGELKVGDIVHSVDGETMVNKVLSHSIDHTKASYRFRVWRPPKVGAAAMPEPMPESSIMDTLRLEKVAQGIARPVGDPSITYISHKGRELDYAFRSPGGTAKHINIAHEMKYYYLVGGRLRAAMTRVDRSHWHGFVHLPCVAFTTQRAHFTVGVAHRLLKYCKTHTRKRACPV